MSQSDSSTFPHLGGKQFVSRKIAKLLKVSIILQAEVLPLSPGDCCVLVPKLIEPICPQGDSQFPIAGCRHELRPPSNDTHVIDVSMFIRSWQVTLRRRCEVSKSAKMQASQRLVVR